MKKIKEDKLQQMKDLTFQHALDTGKVLEDKLNSNITKNEVEKLDEAIQKGVEENVRTYHLRKILSRIDKDDVSDCAIPDNSIYRFYYYIYLLAKETKNKEFIEFCEKLKKKNEQFN